ncbi:MAG: MgtC/SapB family protein [Hyphomicrobiaceae bacterium]
MESLELLQRLSVALAIGLLIGLERGWQTRMETEGERAIGFRTHTLAGILGGVWGALVHGADGSGLIALAIAFSMFALLIGFFRYREVVHERTYGATTLVAAMLAFSLGAFAVLGNMQVAAAAGIATAGLLAMKEMLHSWIKRMTWPELRSVLVLASMTFIALPILPNEPVDPWGALNPYEIWLLTVLIAAISFAGYVAIKLLGDRNGIAVTGIAGGLASSTAVTINMASLAAKQPEHRGPLVAGALISGTVMMARVLTVAGIVNHALLLKLATPLILGGLVQAGAGVYLLAIHSPPDRNGNDLDLKNPFDLVSVLKFGAFLTVLMVLVHFVTKYAGDAGVYLLSAISGVADVDAITLSMARLGGTSLDLNVAARAVLIVVAVNTLSKAALGWITGGAAFGVRMAVVGLTAIAAGGLWLALA